MAHLIVRPAPKNIYSLVLLSGFAALSWEVIWQIKVTQSLGISAIGTALTLAVMMGGACIGSLLMGQALRNQPRRPALRLYAMLEIAIGVSGLLLAPAFMALEQIDTLAYHAAPGMSGAVYFLGAIAIFGLPALCMGATLPVFGLLAQDFGTPISKLYSLNTLGAAASVLIVALILIPTLGIAHTIWLIAAINLIVGAAAFIISGAAPHGSPPIAFEPPPQTIPVTYLMIVAVTGFATFTLEIAWFRALLTVSNSTTDAFVTLLAAMLAALGLAAKNVRKHQQKNKSLGVQLCLAGILILLITPLIEHIDYVYAYSKHVATAHSSMYSENLSMLLNPETLAANSLAATEYAVKFILRFLLFLFLILLPVRLMGSAFPWILESMQSSHKMGMLYAVNTCAAIIGSLTAAWLLLPAIGFAKTAWLTGGLVIMAGIAIIPGIKRLMWTLLGVAALFTAIHYETGIGTSRVQGYFGTDEEGRTAKVLGFYNGPDVTTASIEYRDGSRALLIDSTAATWESGSIIRPSIHYMAWMGHLPMLLHPNPLNALVICFGTGQTANAIRNENPKQLDIVDVNPNVFKLAPHFRSNQGVLNDARVKAITMDGRAYLRRSKKLYDVITLEPMPPNAAGVNSLYSKEFYQLARQRLSPDGVIAQWLPFHILAPYYSSSIAKTFLNAFPNAVLWIDPDSHTGILLGTKDDTTPLTSNWPGLTRAVASRNLSPREIKQHLALDQQQLQAYAGYGAIISDDNQLLAYGRALYTSGMIKENFELLHRINRSIEVPEISSDYR